VRAKVREKERNKVKANLEYVRVRCAGIEGFEKGGRNSQNSCLCVGVCVEVYVGVCLGAVCVAVCIAVCVAVCAAVYVAVCFAVCSAVCLAVWGSRTSQLHENVTNFPENKYIREFHVLMQILV